MPIRIKDTPEPLSPRSLDAGAECRLVESDASRLLQREMERYCSGEVNGRSFLIAGHRGAGKTTMVSHAYLQVWSRRSARNLSVRPLLVLLHGPTLFPHHAPPAENGARADADAEVALKQMVLGLHRAVVAEFAGTYRARALRGIPPSAGDGRSGKLKARVLPAAGRLRDVREASAQLEAELHECPTPGRLREFWEVAAALDSGVLFPVDPPPAADQGFRELLALSGVCEAYCRISGTLTLSETRNARDDDTRESSKTHESRVHEAVAPAVSLLTGGLVGAAVLGSGVPAAAAAAAVGLAAAAGASLVVKSTVTSKQSRTLTRDYSFLRDLSVATLDRALPILIRRLMAAGLAPVFVVDELDKVDHLSDRIYGMVRHLKKLVSENAFFCFLTDRGYFEQVARAGAGRAFPVEHTYYTHRLFVVFRPEDLHRFLHTLLERPHEPGTPASSEEADPAETARREDVANDLLDWRVLPFVLLHRSRMHTVDLWRQIAGWRGATGDEIALRRGEVRTLLVYRLELMAQLAVELVLARRSMRSRLALEPEFRRLAHDALYYPSRRWKDHENEPLDLDDGPGAAAFFEYLEGRTNAAEPASGDGTPHVAAEDREFLLRRTRELAQFLAQPERLRKVFESEWTGYADDPQERELTKKALGEALPSASERPLLNNVSGHFKYRWNYKPSGLSRSAQPLAPVRPDAPAYQGPADVRRGAEWAEDVLLIETLQSFLAEL